eukprot:752603-Hanusia_phi.AAC.2
MAARKLDSKKRINVLPVQCRASFKVPRTMAMEDVHDMKSRQWKHPGGKSAELQQERTLDVLESCSLSSPMMCDGAGEDSDMEACAPLMPLPWEHPPSWMNRAFSIPKFKGSLEGGVGFSCAEERSGEDSIPYEPAAVTSDLQENLNDEEDEESIFIASRVRGFQEREPLAPDSDEPTDVTMGATEDVLDYVL